MKAENDSISIPGAIARFNAAFEQIKENVLERSVEIEAIKLCILTRQHVMLEGLHGIAKSMLAEEIFSRIHGACIFEKLLMKGTQSDEIFGPMNSEIYRREARWEHNTVGFLPDAHFAFLDETYRAADTLLGSLMGILNERKFNNGPKKMKCPLITAIGTTNFVVSDNPELEAFHDRWLVRIKSEPLKAKNLRVKMLGMYQQRMSGDYDADEVKLVTLEEINALQDNLVEVIIEPSLLVLFEELCQKVIHNLPSKPYLSDRRLCQTFRLVVAEAMMHGDFVLKPEHLMAAKYGICKLNDDETTQPFDHVFVTVIGDYERTLKEMEYVAKSQKWINKLINLNHLNLNHRLSQDETELLYQRAKETLVTITSLSGEEEPKQPESVKAYGDMAGELRNVIELIERNPEFKQKTKSMKGAAEKVKKAMKEKAQEQGIEFDDKVDVDVSGLF